MKYRVNWYMGDRGQKMYFVECNNKDENNSDDWIDFAIIELEDKNIITDIVSLLNTKYNKINKNN